MGTKDLGWIRKENGQQQKTYPIYSFPEDDEVLSNKTEMERYNEEEKVNESAKIDQKWSRENSTQSKTHW